MHTSSPSHRAGIGLPILPLILAALHGVFRSVGAADAPAATPPPKPSLVILIGEDEYHTWETLPEFARTEPALRAADVRIIHASQDDKHRFPGFRAALTNADLLLVSVRRRALPAEDLDAIRRHLDDGRPLVGIRTASHAFSPRTEDAPLGSSWTQFDGEVLGGNYHGHHGAGPKVALTTADGAMQHPILAGFDPTRFRSAGSLYTVSPLKPGTTPLLIGTVPGKPAEPVAWTHAYGPKHARIFYTSLGHPEDFREAPFRQLLVNAMYWAMNRPISQGAALPASNAATTASAPVPSSSDARSADAFSTSWQPLAVPGTWEERSQGKLAAYDGVAWYRCQVRPPADWADRAWEFQIENVDNAHEVFLEGTRLGGAGKFPPNYENGDSARARYPIPASLRRPGQWLTVAIRVFDHDGRGGFKGRAPALRAGDYAIALAGEWQFRTDDAPAWAMPAPGETLAPHLYHEVISAEKYERGGVPEKLMASAKPLAPSESARRFTVADGLEFELVLSEPDIAQPLHIDFDERGRLWLTEYRQYPAPAGLKLVSHDQFWRAVYDKVPQPPPHHVRGQDRISIHEDTNGDGSYDRHSVFVDGLNIATSSARGRGGVWILNPPYLLFYPDRNHDDVPDGDPEVHLEGFGIEDTHSVINSLRWGPDGWLYAAQGSTVSGRIRRPGSTNAPVHILGQNIWRYHPELRRFEVFSEGGGNAFGVEMDDAGRIFSGHNGGNTRGFHYVQGGYLQKGFEKHGQLSNPYAFGYFPQMAHNDVERFTHTFVIYGGGAYSGQFDGRLFGIEPLQGRVVMSEVTRDASTFRTRDVGYAVTSADPWFKPVDIKHGPDGALYVADWYDFQVNHWRNYQGNMDAGNGRVYRLKARGAKATRPEDLGRVPSQRLVELLADPNRWIRDVALRLLADRRDASVAPALRAQLESGSGQIALESLWALHLVGGFDEDAVRVGLAHGTPTVREWAVRLLGDSGSVRGPQFRLLAELASRETELTVRQQIAASARRLSPEQTLQLVRALVAHDSDSRDPRQPLMLWWAIEAKADDRARLLAWLGEAELWRRPIVREHLLERIMRRYALAGTPADLDQCAALLNRAPDPAAAAPLLAGFEKGFEGRTLAGLPAPLLAALTKAGGGSLALQLRTGRDGALDRAMALLVDPKSKTGERVQVIQTLGELRLAGAVPALLAAAETGPDATRIAALAALQTFPQAEVAPRVLATLPSASAPVRTAALNLLAGRAAWATALIDAVEKKTVPVDFVGPDIARQLKRHAAAGLDARVGKLWPKSGQPSSADMERQIARLATIVRDGNGDPYNGKKLFTAACGSCHRLFNVGGSIGPDLTPYRRDDLDTLLLNVVNPSAEVREGYEQYLIETKDERSLSGFIVRQDPQIVVLRGLDGQDVPLQRGEISELRPAGLSLMPEGLLDGFDPQQVRDFFAYLRSSQPLAN